VASRNIHNRIAKSILPFLDDKTIDNVNKVTDEPVKWLGPRHRVTRHSSNPLSLDSLLVNHGNWKREAVRQVHLFVDKTEAGKMLEKVMELNDTLGYFTGHRSNRRYRK